MNESNEALQVRLPIVVLIAVITCCSMLVSPAWSHSSPAEEIDRMSSHVVRDTQQGTASEAGMEAASAPATVLYFPFKAAFAIAGGIIGGLAYVFSGFSEPMAKSVWTSSMYGTYLITPEHLTGDRPVRFLGIAAESEGIGTAPAAIHD